MPKNTVKVQNKNTSTSNIQSIPAPRPETGVDLDNSLISTLLENAVNSVIDLSTLEAFTTVAQTRESLYASIDAMLNDATISSVLETYAEDMTAPNEEGKIIWCESPDTTVQKYVTYILESIQAAKHAYDWSFSFLAYGDLYLKLFRKSDYDDDLLFGDTENQKKIDKKLDEASEKTLMESLLLKIEKEDEKALEFLNSSNTNNTKKIDESVSVVVHNNNDPYVLYVEKVKNPGEMFDLQRLGKTVAFIKAPVLTTNASKLFDITTYNQFTQYNMKKDDITIYQPSDYVHASIEPTNSRIAEEVNIYVPSKNTDGNIKEDTVLTYQVKRGQSFLANKFKLWREICLLENSVLLNRTTKSSLIRFIQVEVGRMPKAQIKKSLNYIKSLVEQKTAIKEGVQSSEYTNPGPIENCIYIPVRDGVGGITSSTLGGDVDPKQLTDLDWYNNRLFGAFRAPKQFFGFTDDAAGFSGGQSLSIISSRYGKAVARYQNYITQLVTDFINIILIDRGLDNFVNKFSIKMTTPVTQDEIERRDNISNQIRNITDIINVLGDVDNPVLKLAIIKALLTNAVTNVEVLDLIQKQIDIFENEQKDTKQADSSTVNKDELTSDEDSISSKIHSFDRKELNLDNEDEEEIQISKMDTVEDENTEDENDISAEISINDTNTTEETSEPEESYIPSPEELNIDMTSDEE